MKILTIADKKDEKFLRQKTRPVDFSGFTKAELRKLISEMRAAMKAADGIGLSANQFGFDSRFFIAELPDQKKGLHKLYAIFNPEITKRAGEVAELEEGCLSVPGKYGKVQRYEKVTLSGLDQSGKPLKIKAWGLLAHVFQHEIDHLNGTLFVDKAIELYDAPKSERLKQKRNK